MQRALLACLVLTGSGIPALFAQAPSRWGDELPSPISPRVLGPNSGRIQADTLVWPAPPRAVHGRQAPPAPAVREQLPGWGDELATASAPIERLYAEPTSSESLVWPAAPLVTPSAETDLPQVLAQARWGDELAGEAPPEKVRPAPPLPDGLDWPAAPLLAPPKAIRAIYLNSWAFGSRRFYDLVRLVSGTEINAFVIDVKDDTGYLTYQSQVPTAIQIGANSALRAPDTKARLRLLLAHGIYPIARIVVAKDPLLASRKPDWSVQDVRGGLWRDRLNFAWVDAFNDSVWTYAGALGAEAVRMGFAELQFDYVRFPDEPKARLATAVFRSRQGRESVRDGVARQLRLLRDRVKPLGVPFTIDVFGLTISAETDMGIGQVWEDLVSTADVVLPMVYPSHYYHGYYEIRHPNSEPYRTIRRALQDALKRNALLPHAAQVRPYLQAFTLGPPRYTPDMVRAQIRAAEELGVSSWVLWNPRAVYDRAMLVADELVRTAALIGPLRPGLAGE